MERGPDTSAADQLVVRQHERVQCRLPARVRVDEGSASSVTLAAGESTGAGREVPCEVIDCSAGGIGVRCATFLPKMCGVRVTIPGGGGVIELGARVQRVAMVDRTPTYYLGMAVTGEGEEHARRLGLLLEMARGASAGERPALAGSSGGGHA